jgi:hypothetical protein
MANTQEYRTYLEWRKIGRQVKKGEHGERNHIGETVFGFEQTMSLRTARKIQKMLDEERDVEEEELFRIAYDPNY